MSTLWLHIGHDKTGSSYMQTLLACNRARLEAAGIAYPLGPFRAALAGNGQIGFGNGDVLLRDAPLSACVPAPRGVLFSHEGIFTALAQNFEATCARLEQARAALGLSRIAVLMFVRNPVDHAGSLYQQEVRHTGLTEGPDAYFARYRRPALVWEVLQRMQRSTQITVQVENYSHVKLRLAAVMARWLGVAQDTLTPRSTRPINRGCTQAELRMLRGLNRYAPRLTPWTARTIGVLRPHARPVPVVAGYGAQDQLWRINADAMALMNRHYLTQDNAYRIVFCRPTDVFVPDGRTGLAAG